MLCAVAVVSCGRSPQTYFQRGNKAYADGRYEEASLNYRHAVQKNPNYGEALYGLALSELQLLKTREAYEIMSSASKLLPGREDVKVKYAELCLMLYLPDPKHPAVLYDQLRAIAGELLANNRNSFDGLRIKAFLAQSDNKNAEAVALFGQANSIKPMQPDIVLALAQELIRVHRDAEVEPLCWSLIHAHKSFGPVYDVLYRLYLKQHRIADAERVIRTKADNNPKIAGYITELAAHYAAFHKTAEMNAALQKLRDRPREFPNGRLVLADFYTSLGDLEQARRELEEGAAANPRSKEVYLKRLTDVLLMQGRRDKASQVVDQIIQSNPTDSGSLTVKGALLVDSGRPEDLATAVAVLNQAVAKNPKDRAAHYSLGRGYLALGDTNSARVQFEKALKDSQNNDVASLLQLAAIGIQTQQFTDTLRYSKAILSLQPTNLRAALYQAEAQMGLGNSQEARGELGRLARDHPQFTDAQIQLGFVEIHDRQFVRAERTFARLYKADAPDTRVLRGLVQIRIAQHRPDQALQLLQDEVKKSPSSIPLRVYLADVAASVGRADVSLAEYNQLASSNPTDPQLQVRIGRLCVQEDQLECAVASFQKAWALSPKSASIAALLASTLEASGRRQQAIARYRDSLQLNPGDPLVLNNLAFLLAETSQNLEEAAALAERAQRAAPNNPIVNDTLGWICLKRGMRQTALGIFDSLVRKYPSNATFRYHYGLALLESGNKKQAKAELQTALLDGPSRAEGLRIRELIAKAE